MGFKSGEIKTHCITSKLLILGKFRVSMAVWGEALSCWEIIGSNFLGCFRDKYLYQYACLQKQRAATRWILKHTRQETLYNYVSTLVSSTGMRAMWNTIKSIMGSYPTLMPLHIQMLLANTFLN